MPLQFEVAFDLVGSLSESVLRDLCRDYLDTIVYNDLPQYLIRINNMRLYSRDELWEHARPFVEIMPIDVEQARKTRMRNDVRQLYKVACILVYFLPES